LNGQRGLDGRKGDQGDVGPPGIVGSPGTPGDIGPEGLEGKLVFENFLQLFLLVLCKKSLALQFYIQCMTKNMF